MLISSRPQCVKYRFGVVNQKAIATVNVELDLFRHIPSVGHMSLMAEGQ